MKNMKVRQFALYARPNPVLWKLPLPVNIDSVVKLNSMFGQLYAIKQIRSDGLYFATSNAPEPYWHRWDDVEEVKTYPIPMHPLHVSINVVEFYKHYDLVIDDGHHDCVPVRNSNLLFFPLPES